MEWKVTNALNRDVERQHLNKILKDIRSAVSLLEGKEAATDSKVKEIIRYVNNGSSSSSFSPFLLSLTGAVAGETKISGGNVTLETSLSEKLVKEAPEDGYSYWRKSGRWEAVGEHIISMATLEGPGFPSLDNSDAWNVRTLTGAVGEITVTNGDGAEADPLIGLEDVPDSGAGELLAFERDGKGRISGTREVTTDDLEEGTTNLYFTTERAQDAVGDAITAGTGDGVVLSYDDAGNKINATNTDKGSAAVVTHEAATDPHPQYLLEAEFTWTALPDKPITFPPSAHSHMMSDIEDLSSALVAKVDVSSIGVPNGVASLDADGKLNPSSLPALAITDTYVVNTEAEMLALPAQQGDVAIRSDLGRSFILREEPATALAGWQELLSPSGGVSTVFGRSGAITAQVGDYIFAQIGSKPTTLTGYGITDGVTTTVLAGAGIYATTGNPPTPADLNTEFGLAKTRAGRIIGSTTNTPFPWGVYFQSPYSGAEGAIFAISVTSDAAAFRRHNGGWMHLHHSGNQLALGTTQVSARTALDVQPTNNPEFTGVVKDSLGNVRKVAAAIGNANITADATWLNWAIEKSGNSSYTYTIPAGLGSHGDAITIVNAATAGTITIARASGVEIYRNGTNANIVVQPGSMVTLFRSSITNRWIA